MATSVVDPGDMIFFNPKLAFAINNQVTVSGGAQFSIKQADHVDGAYAGMRKTKTEMDFGLGFPNSFDLQNRSSFLYILAQEKKRTIYVNIALFQT